MGKCSFHCLIVIFVVILWKKASKNKMMETKTVIEITIKVNNCNCTMSSIRQSEKLANNAKFYMRK